jgi:uncharacterized protein YcbX
MATQFSKEMWLDAMGGTKWDRRWMVVDANYRFTTQRKFAQMCHIETKLSGDQATLSPRFYHLR